jgi:ubiquinone/menaquinone biosynthesis C-methylase UbiE
MTDSANWKKIWEEKSDKSVSDFELDRGRSLLDQETEDLSERMLIKFIDPGQGETLLDAGCGTGVNIIRLNSLVKRIIGIDYARGSLERCQRAIQMRNIKNAYACLGSVIALPLPDSSVDRIIFLSVLQYLDDSEVRQAFREFARVLTPGGTVILHVKNFSSLYWFTLWLAKKIKAKLGGATHIEYLRSFGWYVKELRALNYNIVDYDSFNFFMIDLIPSKLTSLIRRIEIKQHSNLFFRVPFMRRHGAELLIKATIPELAPANG